MASPFPITALSAAYTIVSFIQEHGVEPRECDARARRGGLLHSKTYFARLQGSSFSALVSYARALVSQAPQPRMQACLGPDGCSAVFVYTGYHFCSACRIALGYVNDDERNGQHLHRRERDGAMRCAFDAPLFSTHDLADLCLMDDEDEPMLYGTDDAVAVQLREWQRLSRKRRFFGQP